MASFKKKLSGTFKRDKVGDSFPDGPSTTGNTANQQRESSTQRFHEIETMRPNKELEEKVLQNRFEYLSSNLPPDDVAIEMNSKGLLTAKEHEEYMSMKRAHTSDSTKSEYLLQCLGKRKGGFLTRFCKILKAIEQASYLADDIEEKYKMARLQLYGSNSRLDRLSNLSLSDPDLYSKSAYGAQECTRCKILERRLKALEKKHTKLKEQQEVFQTIILPFKPLAEVAQEQLNRAEAEGSRLKELLPSVQEAVTQTTSQIASVQLSLKKINEMLEKGTEKQTEPEKASGAAEPTRESLIDLSEKPSVPQLDNVEQTSLWQHDGSAHQLPTLGLELNQHPENKMENSQKIRATSTRCVMKRTKSESGVVQRRQIMQKMRAVESADSGPPQFNCDDPQLLTILKQRREQIDDASDNHT